MITKENAKDWLPLVQAMADGKQLQVVKVVDGKWLDVEMIWPRADALHEPKAYRVKPEPRRFWVNIYRPGFNSEQQYAYTTEQKAESAASAGLIERVEVAEVL